jgi:hypothetical protein
MTGGDPASVHAFPDVSIALRQSFRATIEHRAPASRAGRSSPAQHHSSRAV